MSSPVKSRWSSRIGTVRRRAASLGAPRSSSSDRDDAASTRSSIRGISTTPVGVSTPTPFPSPELQATTPNPIAESPAREAASSEGSPTPAPILETEVALTSPQGYIPPLFLDLAAVESVEESFHERSVGAANPEAVFIEPQVEADVAELERAVTVSVTQKLEPTRLATPVEPIGEAVPYLEFPVQAIGLLQVVEVPMEGFQIVVETTTLGGGVQPIPQEQSRGLDQAEVINSPPLPEKLALAAAIYPLAYDMQGGASRKDSEGQMSTILSMDEEAGTSSGESSIRILEDPFADPVTPRISASRHPELPNSYDSAHRPQDQGALHKYARGAVTSSPPSNKVAPSKSLHEFPSTESINANRRDMETEETRPLLSRPGSLRKNYVQPNVSSIWPAQPSMSGPRLHDLGWIEYQLPDGTIYYVHPTRHVTTDVDLRVDKFLDIVTTYLEQQKDGSVPQGMELWVRDGQAQKSKSTRGVLVLVMCMVNHRKRVVQFDHEVSRSAKGKNVEADDHLDMEYRYWLFVEAHPTFTSLPVNAKIEAMDMLTWAWSDRLLPSQRTTPAPFTQEECHELMSQLRSFSNEPNDTGLQAIVQTRIISRVLLRVARWRQLHFRPNKPLPRDVGNDVSFRKTLRHTLFDLALSCVCLGIPYIFLKRHQHHRLDEESGRHNSAPMFVISACPCFIAVILLSACMTFLSLPGLDDIPRVAAFVAILFSSFSMVSTVVVTFKCKAGVERPALHVGDEEFMMISRRNVIMSLPLVFLLYAIVGFVTGIILHLFRGATTSDPLWPEHPFEDSTKWTMVGVLGGLAGILTTLLFLHGRCEVMRCREVHQNEIS